MDPVIEEARDLIEDLGNSLFNEAAANWVDGVATFDREFQTRIYAFMEATGGQPKWTS